MTTLITLSGPEDAEQDARASLAAAGFTLTDDTYQLDEDSAAGPGVRAQAGAPGRNSRRPDREGRVAETSMN
jgi:hypothetical protein